MPGAPEDIIRAASKIAEQERIRGEAVEALRPTAVLNESLIRRRAESAESIDFLKAVLDSRKRGLEVDRYRPPGDRYNREPEMGELNYPAQSPPFRPFGIEEVKEVDLGYGLKEPRHHDTEPYVQSLLNLLNRSVYPGYDPTGRPPPSELYGPDFDPQDPHRFTRYGFNPWGLQVEGAPRPQEVAQFMRSMDRPELRGDSGWQSQLEARDAEGLIDAIHRKNRTGPYLTESAVNPEWITPGEMEARARSIEAEPARFEFEDRPLTEREIRAEQWREDRNRAEIEAFGEIQDINQMESPEYKKWREMYERMWMNKWLEENPQYRPPVERFVNPT